MFMSLRNFLRYNIDDVTVWEHIITDEKDNLGRPLKKWKKTAYKGKWENSIRTIRSMSGDSISSTGNVILPVLIDVKKEFLIEKTDGKIAKEGNIVDTNGKVLGKHMGLAFYTIGQRKGLGISSEKPIYVLKLDEETNSIIMGSNEELFKEYLTAEKINLLKVSKIEELEGMECFAKTRSRDKFHPCRISVISDDEIKVLFTQDKVRAVTPGQGVVLYDENYEVIGSGFIK